MTKRFLFALALLFTLPRPIVAQVGTIRTGDGSATIPAHSFTNDNDTGLYRVGANDLGLTTSGTLRLDIDTARVLSTLPARGPNGSASAPTWSFANSTNAGLYRVGTDNIGFSTSGTLRLDLDTARVLSTLPFRGPDGSSSAPTYSFGSETTLGFYRAASSTIGVRGHFLPSSNYAFDVGGAPGTGYRSVATKYLYIGDEASLINDALLQHADGTDPNGVLTIALGDGSALGKVYTGKLAVGQQSDPTYPDGRTLDVRNSYTGADFSAPSYYSWHEYQLTPTADITKAISGLYADVVFNGTHNDSSFINGLAGEAYWQSTGTAGSMTAVSGWAQVTNGTVTGLDGFYIGTDVESGKNITENRTFDLDAVYGTGTVGTDYGLYLSDRRNFQAGGGTVSGSQYLIFANIGGTSGRYYVKPNGEQVATSLQLDRNGVTKPTCVATPADRGKIWYTAGGAGVKDDVQVCAKDAGDVYAWRTIY